MAKQKTIFACTNCGATSPKWIGKCPACEEWNTYQEEVIFNPTTQETKLSSWKKAGKTIDPQPIELEDIAVGSLHRIDTGDKEFNRVLGGGIVPGSLVLIGGQPGIGKSTLSLQVAMNIKAKVLYVTGEESEDQIKMRANRLGKTSGNCFILTEINTNKILNHAQTLQPDLIIIDSIQTISSPNIESMPGTVSQVRECTGELQRYSKETNTPIFIIGHITKDGAIAGPKLLEHIVDTVLQFEGERQYAYRILRTLKNRFGSTDELGIYEMQSGGLREVNNPSELLLTQRDDELSGSSVCATLEGLRPMLIETQALVGTAIFGTPQRSSTGFELRRLHMLLAVLEKKAGLRLSAQDVFVNIAGGLRIEDPAIDLGVVASIVSSFHDIPVNPKICFIGEIGLSGEVRAVSRIEQRISEAEKLGYEVIYLSKYNKGIDSFSSKTIELRKVGKVDEALHFLFA